MKNFIVIIMIMMSRVQAYEVGDTIDEEIVKKLNLSEHVTVIDFFASWCVSCEKELPLVNDLSQELKSVIFIGVDTDEKLEEGKAFQKKLGLEFPIYNDVKQEVVDKFNPIGIPAIYYIKDKKVVKKLFGMVDKLDEVIKKDIEAIQ